jgi:DNA-binding MarR family transcriptional regulator
MQVQPAAVEALALEVRACFNRLKVLGERLHAGSGVTLAMRAVLEALVRSGDRPAATIARERGVTRQHVQALVDALVVAGLAATRPNPADRRAPLVAVTAAGRERFAAMRVRETEVLAGLAHRLAGRDLEAARRTLAAFATALDGELIAEAGDGAA